MSIHSHPLKISQPNYLDIPFHLLPSQHILHLTYIRCHKAHIPVSYYEIHDTLYHATIYTIVFPSIHLSIDPFKYQPFTSFLSLSASIFHSSHNIPFLPHHSTPLPTKNKTKCTYKHIILIWVSYASPTNNPIKSNKKRSLTPSSCIYQQPIIQAGHLSRLSSFRRQKKDS